jgi:hypothetical protein
LRPDLSRTPGSPCRATGGLARRSGPAGASPLTLARARGGQRRLALGELVVDGGEVGVGLDDSLAGEIAEYADAHGLHQVAELRVRERAGDLARDEGLKSSVQPDRSSSANGRTTSPEIFRDNSFDLPKSRLSFR